MDSNQWSGMLDLRGVSGIQTHDYKEEHKI